MVNNGSLSYDHERDGRPTELGGCTAIVRNIRYDTFLVIRYVKRHLTVSHVLEQLVVCPASAPVADPGLSALFLASALVADPGLSALPQIMMDIDGRHEWRDCIEMPGVRLPRGYYFGTSSITGDLSGTAALSSCASVDPFCQDPRLGEAPQRTAR